ncbi:FecR family protein, partial [Ruminococcus sp. YE78]
MKLASLLHSKLFVGITAAVVSAAAVVTGIMLKNHDEDYRVIKVFEVNGQALVERSDVGEIDPYSGMNLENGDKVSTFKDSTMRIVLDDTKYVFMEQESQLELEASGNASDSKTRLVLKSGAILNEITEQLSAGSAYEVTAPKATMAVHGTSFRVSVSKDDYGDYITKLEVFHGTVKVCLLDENGNPTDKTAMVGPDKCIIIKTVHNEHSGNDPSIDGTSFFVTPDENGYLVIVPDGEDPRQPIDYNKIPYSTLEELYKTDAQNEITLYEEVIEKIIEAMNGQEGNSHDDTPSQTDKDSSSETTTTTTTKALSSEPDETTTTKAHTTTKAQTTTAPVSTTAPKENGSSTSTTAGSSGSSGSSGGGSKTTTKAVTTTTTTTTAPPPPVSVEYTVKFYDYDGTLLSTQTVEEGGSATAPTNYKGSYVDADGWTWIFSEWDKSFTKIKADTTITAVYTQKPQYTVIFKDYDGTQLSKQTIEEGKDATAPKNYKGTYTDEDGWTWTFSEWDKPFTGIEADTTVTAVYTQKPQYTVIFKDYDGTQLSKQTIEEGKNATAPKNYKGSYIDDDGWTWTFSEWDNPFTSIKADTTVTAVYVQKPHYTVIFKDYDGTQLSKQTVEEGKDATAPENYKGSYIDEDGWTWTFSEWDKPFTEIKSDTTVTAVYVQKPQYTVIFKDYDGTQLSKQTVEEGKDATTP